MSSFSDSKRNTRKPRVSYELKAKRAPAKRKIFKWWKDPVGRLVIIGGQRSILNHVRDVKAHADFSGEKQGSIAHQLKELLKLRHPAKFEYIMGTCMNKDYPGESGVSHKIYERIHKVAVVREIGQKGKDEHYLTRKDPATEAEIRDSDLWLVNPVRTTK